MEPQRVNSTDLRTKTRDILEAAHFMGQHFVVENHGKAIAAVIGIEDYERLMGRAITRSRHKAERAAPNEDSQMDSDLITGP